MFQSPSSSSSSDSDGGGGGDAVEAAARAIAARRSRGKIRPVDDALLQTFAGTSKDTATDAAPVPVPPTSTATTTGGSKYIARLLVRAKEREEEAEARRAEQIARGGAPRFVTKSYAAALRRRRQAEQGDADAEGSNELEQKVGKKRVNSALQFVVADMEERQQSGRESEEIGKDRQRKVEKEQPKEKDKVDDDKTKPHEHEVDSGVEWRQQSPGKDKDSKVEDEDVKKKQEKKNTGTGLGGVRNDEEAIEAYRQRYMRRRERYLADGTF